MEIKYYHKNIESLEVDLQNYIEKKLSSVEKMVDVKIAKIEVSERRNEKFFMAVTILAKNGDEFRAEHNNGISLNECVDIIENELKNQIRKSKGKAKDLEKRGGISLKKKMVIDENARF